MSKEAIISSLSSVKKWRKGDSRAPHKPLLLLIYLARLSKGIKKPLLFSKVEEKLTDLLQEFGPSRQSYHPEEPFARLTNDGIWLLDKNVNTKGSVSISELREVNPAGRLVPDIEDSLRSDPILLAECIQLLLDENFPESIHEEIKSAIGITSRTVLSSKKVRDPKFREEVLIAYEYSCAVCGFNLHIKNASAGVEAAHIRWHAMNGPDHISNGIALCTMHHKLFDLGAMGVNADLRVQVSPQANGQGKEMWLNRFEGTELRKPQKRYEMPKDDFLIWHEREVFKA